MRRLVLHLIVAFLAFVVGVTAAALLGGLFGHRTPHRRGHHRVQVEVEKVRHVEPPARQSDCPYSRGMSELPVPPSDWENNIEEPLPPLPPTATSPSKAPRISVRRADGTWEVIEPGNVRVEKH
jgi:hypothetical protein